MHGFIRCAPAIKESGAQALAVLKNLPSLTSLTVDLQRNEIGDAGARALATLHEAPRLQTLILNLQRNEVGFIGAQALGSFKNAPSLTSLSLNLHGNEVMYCPLDHPAGCHNRTSAHGAHATP